MPSWEIHRGVSAVATINITKFHKVGEIPFDFKVFPIYDFLLKYSEPHSQDYKEQQWRHKVEQAAFLETNDR